ncbi:MAG: retropepsin-like aspartic protease [Gallionella sp.]|nr:retropepsin-like aspartic protease [Gallionella sp.]
MFRNIWLGAVLFGALLASCGVFADTVFKCRGSDGKLLYQASKCAATDEVSSWQTRTHEVSPADGARSNPDATEYSLVIQADRMHAYWVDGEINGVSAKMMVDTGATAVVIPSDLAARARVGCEGRVSMMTANGITSNCRSRLKSVKLGRFVISDVTVTVAGTGTPVLLGQAALSRFKVEQENGLLRLTLPTTPR